MSIGKGFDELRDRVVALLNRSAAVIDELAPLLDDDAGSSDNDTLDDASSDAAAFRDRAELVRKEEFVVVVAGEMNRGKTTLLNAMLERPLLTMDVNECTATVSFLRHPPPDGVMVHFRDGSPPTAVPSAEITDYTSRLSRKGEDTVADLVDHIDVFVESPFLRYGVLLVDTPGTNTTTANHQRITNDQIDRSHAAIFVTSADTQMTRSDRDFLDRITESVARIFVVVNKIDHVSDSDVPRVLEAVKHKVQESLRDATAKVYAVVGVSAAKAMLARTGRGPENMVPRDRRKLDDPGFRDSLLDESRILDFESALERYLFSEDERGRDLLHSPLEFIRDKSNELASMLDRQVETLDGRYDLRSHELNIQKAERSVDDQKRRLQDMSASIAEELSNALAKARATLEEKRKLAEQSLQDQVHEYDSPEALNASSREVQELPGRALERLGRQAGVLLRDSVDRVLRKQTRDLRKQLRNTLGELAVGLPKIEDVTVQVADAKVNPETDEEIDKLKADIRHVEGEQDKLESAFTGRSEMEYQAAQEEILRSREDRIERLQVLGSRPQVRITPTTKSRDGKVRGLSGAVSFVLFGRPQEHYVEEVKDDEEVRDYNRRRDAIEKEAQRRIDSVQQRVEEARGRYAAELVARRKAEKLEEIQRNKQKTLDALNERRRDSAEKARQAAVRTTRDRLLRAFHQGVETLQQQWESVAGRCEEMAVDYVAEMSHKFDRTLQSKQQELTKLVSLRDKEASENEAAKERINDLLRKLRELGEGAASLMNDHEAFCQEHAAGSSLSEL